MPGFPLTLAAVASCFHQGRATIAPDQTAVMIQGALAATSASLIAVAGCPFTPVAYHPCVTIRWLLPSTKVTAQGKPLILTPPPGAGVEPGSASPPTRRRRGRRP